MAAGRNKIKNSPKKKHGFFKKFFSVNFNTGYNTTICITIFEYTELLYNVCIKAYRVQYMHVDIFWNRFSSCKLI